MNAALGLLVHGEDYLAERRRLGFASPGYAIKSFARATSTTLTTRGH